jgi:hypothetical protein
VTYQPEPLNWIPAAEIWRGALAPHLGHFLISEAECFSIFSKRCPHLSHLYSYKGKTEFLPQRHSLRENFSTITPLPAQTTRNCNEKIIAARLQRGDLAAACKMVRVGLVS